MLCEIYCEQFHQKQIHFNTDLSVVLGTETGDNSIGKSTFMLIVDFVFGGNTYVDATDIRHNIGDHRICWSFKINGQMYYFARTMFSPNIVEICNSAYQKIREKRLSDYTAMLRNLYHLELPELSFREAVGRYIRTYGKQNCSEKQPLHAFLKERDIEAMYSLLKLFDLYSPLASVRDQVEESDEKYKTYKKAQKLKLIENISERQYRRNKDRILKIESQIEDMSNVSLLDVDSSASEEAVFIKKNLSQAKRYRSGLLNRLSAIEENQRYPFSKASKSFNELEKFFPEINLRHLTEIENFHRKISLIVRQELEEEQLKLEKEISDYDSLIDDFENQLKELIHNPDISKIILQRHSLLYEERQKLLSENKVHEELGILKSELAYNKERLARIKQNQFAILEHSLNSEMERINDVIYAGVYNAPLISFRENSYRFLTPDDTGTGIAYKGLIVYDLAVLRLTALPILVHDSLLLKQIADNAIEKILELYCSSGKQIIIALDKQSSYGIHTEQILESHAVLKLAPNGQELFGRFWGKKDSE